MIVVRLSDEQAELITQALLLARDENLRLAKEMEERYASPEDDGRGARSIAAALRIGAERWDGLREYIDGLESHDASA